MPSVWFFYFCTMKYLKIVILICFVFSLITSCEDDDDITFSPKPRGFHRISFPEKKYHPFTSNCNYTFEVPNYSVLKAKSGKDSCWYDVMFPAYKATVHLSYKSISNNLSKYIEDSRDFAIRHQIKATGLNESVVYRDTAKVYGLLYDIAGNTASSVQFYVTDSTHHFLRGALYFNVPPNVDSMQLVIDYLRKDIIHLIKTTKWK